MDGDRRTFRITHSHDVHVDALLGGGFGGTDSVVLMVLAVGDQDDRLIGRLVRGKGTGGQVDGGTDRRTLRRDHRRVDRGQEHLGRDIIRGDRQLRESVAGEHDQAYLVIRKAVRQSGQHLFGLIQTVGRHVLGQHGVGYVQTHHDLYSLTLHRLQFRAELRPRYNKDNHGNGSEQQPKLQMLALGRYLGHQLGQQRRVTVFLYRFLLHDQGVHVERHQRGKEEKQI